MDIPSGKQCSGKSGRVRQPRSANWDQEDGSARSERDLVFGALTTGKARSMMASSGERRRRARAASGASTTEKATTASTTQMWNKVKDGRCCSIFLNDGEIPADELSIRIIPLTGLDAN